MLQLFADLNDVFANKYLHKVDSDKILTSEIYHAAQNTVSRLRSVDTNKANDLLDNLKVDEFGNVSADFKQNDSVHTIRLNEIVTRRGN